MKKSRTQMTKLNAKVSILNRIVTLICNFLCRSVFIKVLGSEYLGVGGMFGNVFSVLSLCELGFGEAAAQAMYKPLADGDMITVRRIVNYYSKVYKYVALITFAASSAFLPFLPEIFPDVVNISGYRTVYFLFVIHQTLSYCFAPKRALVMCDQRIYVINSVRTATAVTLSIAQIISLMYTRNYLIYIFLRILFLSVDGAVIEMYADKKYGFHEITDKRMPTKECCDYIINNTKSLAIHRIGSVINNSTDSILLSSCLGLSQMGVFSNYSLIINSLGSFISLAVNSASASVGNLGASSTAAKSEKVLERLCFANFVLLTNCTTLLLCLINPIIKMWIGEKMCFSMAETAVIIACFYVSYIRDPVQVFLHAYGVYKSTKYIYLVRGLLNLVLSYIMVKKMGVAGVFAGTLISTLVIPFAAEPYMLFRYGFGTGAGRFFVKYLGYVLTSLLVCTVCYVLTASIDAGNISGIINRGFVVAAITNIILLALYGRTENFRSLFSAVFCKRAKLCNTKK